MNESNIKNLAKLAVDAAYDEEEEAARLCAGMGCAADYEMYKKIASQAYESLHEACIYKGKDSAFAKKAYLAAAKYAELNL